MNVSRNWVGRTSGSTTNVYRLADWMDIVWNVFIDLHFHVFFSSGEAKDQISHLTDEISFKAEDNIAQQVEIIIIIIIIH